MTRPRRFAIMAILLSTSCASLAPSVPSKSGGSSLNGIWEICLRLEEAGVNVSQARTSAGYLSLTPFVGQPRPWMYSGAPSHHGVYTVDLARLGIGRDPRIPVPLAGARMVSDSVYLELDPFGSHGSIVMVGRTSPGAIIGNWYHHAYVGGAHGTFTMRKLEESTLPVPYPIGGPLASPPIAGCL
jgi:hypothetical protein